MEKRKESSMVGDPPADEARIIDALGMAGIALGASKQSASHLMVSVAPKQRGSESLQLARGGARIRSLWTILGRRSCLISRPSASFARLKELFIDMPVSNPSFLGAEDLDPAILGGKWVNCFVCYHIATSTRQDGAGH